MMTMVTVVMMGEMSLDDERIEYCISFCLSHTKSLLLLNLATSVISSTDYSVYLVAL